MINKLLNSYFSLIGIVIFLIIMSWLSQPIHAESVAIPTITFSLTPFPPTPTPTRYPDTVPPQTSITIKSESENNGWYTSSITITFSAIDNLIGLEHIKYSLNDIEDIIWVDELSKIPITITQEGLHNFTYYGVDHYNNTELPHTTTLKIDLTPPIVTLPIDIANGYTRCDSIPYMVNDSLGTTVITSTLDGQPITQTVELFKVALGSHTLAITATDEAGWVTTATQSFTLTANIPSLICTKHMLYDLGEIYGNGANGIVNSLDAKLDAAQKSIDKGNINTAINQLNAFINEVEAQRDKKITPFGADLMIHDSQEIIALLERGEYHARQAKRNQIYLPVLVKH